MENNKNESVAYIVATITKNRTGVLEALRKSEVAVNDNINENNLLNLILSEINKGNGFLIYYLGNVIDNTLALDKKSNSDGTTSWYTPYTFGGSGTASTGTSSTGSTGSGDTQNWFQKNEGLINLGAAMLGGLLGGRDKTPATPTGGSSIDQYQAARYQAELEAERLRNAAKNANPPKNNTVLIVSIIAGALLIGTIITVIVIKNN